jgi:N-acetyl-anhydromuramyl-L-alanine amidase AmpD
MGTHGQLRANGCSKTFCHDAAGWAHGALARFENPDNRGSAHIIINLDGPPWQFIDFDDAAWHAGGYIPGLGEFANLFAWGLEFEGGYPTANPITDYQVDIAIDLLRWLPFEYRFHWQAVRRVDLWEHREVYPTACPSDRIRWPEIIAGLKGDHMDDDQVRRLITDELDPLKWQLGKVVAYLQERQAADGFFASYPLTPQDTASLPAKQEHDRMWNRLLARVFNWRSK